MIIRLMIIFCFVFSSIVSLSQTPPYYQYTSSEGLASSQVYEMIQDRKGYMWFATANGVSRFDGHKFENYTTKDSLNSNNIICLTEGNKGEIYFGNEFKGFNIYAGGKIEKYSFQTKQNPIIIGMITDADKLYSYHAFNISKVSHENTLNLLIDINYTDSNKINKMAKIHEGSMFAATKNGLYKFENGEFKKLNIKGLVDQEFFWISSGNHNNIILGAKGKIYEIKDYAVIRTIEVDLFENNNIIRVLKDSKGNIWFTIMNKGFYFIKAGTEKIEDIGKKMGLEKKLMNNFFEDTEGNLWVSTFGDGVFCLNNLYLNNYSQKDGLSNNKVNAIVKDQSDRVFAGTLDGLNVLDENGFSEIINRSSSRYDYMFIYDLKCRNDSVYVCGTHKNPYGKISKSLYKNDIIFSFGSSSFCITNDNKFITGGWSNEIYIRNFPVTTDYISKIFLFGDKAINNKIHRICEDSRNNFWFGTNDGLCRIINGEKSHFPDNEILSTAIKYISEDRNSKVWFAGDKGISSYRLTDSIISNYAEINEHDLSSSNVLSVDKYNRLWIGSMNGLFIFSNDDKESVKVLNTETGLPSNEILSLCYDSVKNYMWIGSAGGLSSMNVTEFDNGNISPVKVQIRKVKAEDSVYADSDNFIFEPDRKNIQIEFTAVNFSSPSTLKYQYKLEDNWIDIHEDNINFSSLKKGCYSLAIRGKMINSLWGEPALIFFTVLPKFTETFLFQGSIVGLIVIGIVFGASRRIKNIRARDREKLEINNQVNDLKHKALSSMMNPHFIFNSLNSVQYLINTDKKREANDYISLMAKLIRMNLESASESLIRLDEEIKRLDLYLQIEKLRFSKKFNYEISVGSDLDSEAVFIPNMIIQPFVENSIWHGIMPSGKDGFIMLSFNFENVIVNNIPYKFFSIRIIDNGIGLNEAQKNKKDGHVSRGIQIIQERLILLSKERNLPQPVFEDLGINGKDLQGTEVLLSIPPEMYKSNVR